MRKPIDPRHLRARCAGLLLPGVGYDLHQWSVQRPGRCGIVLHERVHGWGDMSVEHEPSDMRGRGQRLHRLHHFDLRQWRVQRPGWRGIMLHERLHGRGDMSVEHESSDMHRSGQRLYREHHLHLLDWAGLRAPLPALLRFKLGRVADAQ